jgi:hypothetical protein
VGAGAGGLFGALMGIGVGKSHVIKYREFIAAGKYLVVAHGSAAEVQKAREILTGVSPTTVETHI